MIRGANYHEPTLWATFLAVMAGAKMVDNALQRRTQNRRTWHVTNRFYDCLPLSLPVGGLLRRHGVSHWTGKTDFLIILYIAASASAFSIISSRLTDFGSWRIFLILSASLGSLIVLIMQNIDDHAFLQQLRPDWHLNFRQAEQIRWLTFSTVVLLANAVVFQVMYVATPLIHWLLLLAINTVLAAILISWINVLKVRWPQHVLLRTTIFWASLALPIAIPLLILIMRPANND
jgi:hypothetical protein